MNIASFSVADPYSLLAILLALALAPFVALMVTSYVKLVVVFNLIRNALGVQQIPPNMVLNGLALILTLYIMNPVFEDVFNSIRKTDFTKASTDDAIEAVITAASPLKSFLLKHSTELDRTFFIKATKMLWGEQRASTVKVDDFLILVPAFTVKELSSAFQIGFLIYLPFLVVDLVVSNVLLAMGMMMVSPMTISLPFKLLLFVVVDGWTRLIQGLVLSYM